MDGQTNIPSSNTQDTSNAVQQNNSQITPTPRTENPHVIDQAPIHDEKTSITSVLARTVKIVSLIVFGIVIVILTNLYVVQMFSIDGESMSPTLSNGNKMLLWKIPRTWAGITKKQFIPKRWDIVVVRNNEGEQYIKRVIGLPGERVVIKDGSVTIFNMDNPKGFNPDENICCNNLAETAGSVNRQVNSGEVFALGDNREPAGSIDSRSGLGNIPADEIVGKAKIRLSPFTVY